MALPGLHLRYNKHDIIRAVEGLQGIRHLEISSRHDLNELINYLISDLDMFNISVSNCEVKDDTVTFDFYCDDDCDIKQFGEEVKRFQEVIDEAG